MIIASSLFVLTVISCIYISDWKKPEDIISIETEIETPLFLEHDKYIIDFSKNTFTYNDFKSDSEKITAISDEDKKNFVRKANIHGFFDWKEVYESTENGENDSAVYSIYITYNDNSEQKIFFQIPDTPVTFEAMREVFHETFGYYILWGANYENQT